MQFTAVDISGDASQFVNCMAITNHNASGWPGYRTIGLSG